jgi:hypothetical protein
MNITPRTKRPPIRELLDIDQAIARRALRTGGDIDAPGGIIGTAAAPMPSRTPFLHQTISCSSAGSNTLIPGVNGLRIAIYEMLLWPTADGTLIFADGDQGVLLQLTNAPALSAFTLAPSEDPHWLLSSSAGLVLSLSSGYQVDGYVKYRVEGQ